MPAADSPARLGLPDLGFGVGLRPQHLPAILAGGARVGWFEIISENYLGHAGYDRAILDNLARTVPIVLHGVSLSIGSDQPLDRAYVARLGRLADEVGAVWVSDHLCWTGLGSHNSHDLLPLPLNARTLAHVAERVEQVQDLLGRPLVLENPSSYVQFRDSTLTEWEFLGELATATGCGLLLDVNNVYVSAFNHRFDPEVYIRALPHRHVVQIHLAGPTLCGDVLIDTHDGPVLAPVWDLYALAQELTGGVSTLLEWDADLPDYPGLLAELDKARQMAAGQRPDAPAGPAIADRALSTPIHFHLDRCANG